MTAMTEERTDRQDRPARTAIRRPASGIAIDPDRLTWYRERLGWSRQDLSDKITELGLLPVRHLKAPDDGHRAQAGPDRGTCTTCGDKISDGLSRDAIAKIENRTRKPKPRTVRALCEALSLPDDPVTPLDLMPGGPALTPHAEADARRDRLDHNRELREFAKANDFPYKNPDTGRVYYSVALRQAYAQHVLDSATQDGDDDSDLLAS